MKSKFYQVKTQYGTFAVEMTKQGVRFLLFPKDVSKGSFAAADFQSRPVIKILEQYFKGKKVHFRRLSMDLSGFSPFEKKVLKKLQRVPAGKTLSYQKLAAAVGSPKASRAVGSVMRKNRIPILIPCHRVIRSNGSLGNFAKGTAWKHRLLSLENPKQFSD